MSPSSTARSSLALRGALLAAAMSAGCHLLLPANVPPQPCAAALFTGTWQGGVEQVTRLGDQADDAIFALTLSHGDPDRCTLSGVAELLDGAASVFALGLTGFQSAGQESGSQEFPRARLDLSNRLRLDSILDRSAASAVGGDPPTSMEVTFTDPNGVTLGTATLVRLP